MYYGLGTAEEILANLYSVLTGITGTWKLEFCDYQRVEASGVNPEDYPGVYINNLRIDKERLLKNLVRNVFTVVLVGWMWASEDGKLATEMNDFIEKVKDTVMLDPYRNSKAYDTQIKIIATDAGSRYPQGQFLLTMEITFYSDE